LNWKAFLKNWPRPDSIGLGDRTGWPYKSYSLNRGSLDRISGARRITLVGAGALTSRRLQTALGCVSKERAIATKRNDIFENRDREPQGA
jgi:hypothetical protein